MRLKGSTRLAHRSWLSLLIGLACWLAPVLAQGQTLAPLPQAGGDQHLGVVTCAGSTCHGALQPSNRSNVLQNEFVTWHREDRHAQAYKVLLNDQSRRIAANLGLEAAEKADLCLDCHADNVPASARGKRFQIADGVGCEACHGGAERYLGPHLAADATHARNLELGMYPTAQPAARARLCLSCHLGTRDKLATHRIMGAGHPRLSFELDTFSDIQPAHFRIDVDYRKRKGEANSARLWASGQLVAARSFLELYLAYQGESRGLFPELFFFDCHSCHRPLRDPQWQPRATTGLGPGLVRINDAHLLMLRHLAQAVAPAERAVLERALLALHKAASESLSASLEQARQLLAILGRLETHLAASTFDAGQMQLMLASVVADGVRGEYRDYAGAEQAAMAIGSLIHALRVAGAIDEARAETLNRALDPIYEALQDDLAYRPAELVSAMQAFQARL